jgi:uncharacterized membrane protein YedE/YeeE
MPKAVAFLLGLLFGVGLIVSGMTNPAKVLGFLDIAGAWDPSLALVMAAAIAAAFVPFRLATARARSLLGDPMQLPTRRDLEPRLILGSAVFGIGWGLAGFCPGPAVVSIGAGLAAAGWFTAAMLAGMGLFALLEQRRRSVKAHPDSAAA